MMIISILILEFQFAVSVERKLAYNELNQIQAYYLAKSGARLGLLRLALYGKIKRSPQLKSISKSLPLDSYLDLIWNLPLPAFPPDATKIVELDTKERNEAAKVLEQTRIKDGKYSYVITSESSKFNLNHLVVTASPRPDRINLRDSNPQGLYHYVAVSILNFLEKLLKDSPDPYKEYGNMRPEEVVLDIMDWVNSGGERFGGGDKDAYYEKQSPPYRAKRGRFFTVDELRLVRGIDEKLFGKLKPVVTVYSYDGRININNANDDVIRSLYPDFTDDDIKRLREERDRLGGSWPTEKDFVNFIVGTLGRNGFKSLYDKEENYPFTVSSQSFLIESLGMIQKSKTQIQKVIRVAAALTSARGGEVDASLTSKEPCEKNPAKFWDTRTAPQSVCRERPSTSKECENIAGQWTVSRCCKLNNIPQEICPAKDSDKAKADANSLKVLYWSET